MRFLLTAQAFSDLPPIQQPAAFAETAAILVFSEIVTATVKVPAGASVS
jgi:hypothetical protein